MKTLIIKVGANAKKEIISAFQNPKRKAIPNTHTLYLKDTKELYEILSPQRMELLMYLTKNCNKELTITQLATKLNRRQEAISRDTILLQKYNMIQKIKEKQKVYVKAIYDSLDLKLVGITK